MLPITGVVYFISYLYGAIKINSKKFTFFLMALMMYLMCSAPNFIPDYATYQNSYDTGIGRFEWGYTLLSKIAKHLGFTFGLFRSILLISGIVILYMAVRKYTNSITIFFAFYFIFPFFMDIVQIRNFLMMSFILYASTFMIERSKLNFFKVFILICIAASFHSLGYVYLLVLFIDYLDWKSIATVASAIILILVDLSSLLVNYKTILLSTLQNLGINNSIDDYVGTYVSNGTSVSSKYYVIFHILLVLFVFFNFLYMKSLKENGSSKLDPNLTREIRTQYVFLQFLIISLIAMPLYQIDSSFFRIVRDVFPLSICTFITTYWHVKSISVRVLYYLFFTIFVVAFFILFIKPVIFQNTIEAIFNN